MVLSPGVKCLESKGASEFFYFLFFSFLEVACKSSMSGF